MPYAITHHKGLGVPKRQIIPTEPNEPSVTEYRNPFLPNTTEGIVIDSWGYDPSNDLVGSGGSGEVITEYPVRPGRGASVGAITYI